MIVWVTGASSGVGLATAKHLAAQGHQVVGTTSKPVTDPLDFPFKLVQLDQSKPETLRNGFERMKSSYGIPDALIANAGMGEIGSIEETSLEFANRMFQVNYFAHVQLIQWLAPVFRERQRGHFLFTGSVVYSLCFPFKAQYNASKSALAAFALSLRQELRPYNVYVHMIAPGWIRSDFHNRQVTVNRDSSPYKHRFAHFEDKSRDKQPKYPTGEDIAKVYGKILLKPKKFPTRIPIGPDAKLFFKVRKLLPYSFFERFLLDRY